MRTQLKFVSAFVIAFSICSLAFAATPTAQTKEDLSQANTACAKDAETSGCTGKEMGKGLGKCLHDYKKKTPSFQLSPDCKAAMQKAAGDRKANKQ